MLRVDEQEGSRAWCREEIEREERNRGGGGGEEKTVTRAKARISRGQRHTEPGSVKRQCPLSVRRTCAGQVSV